MRNKIIHINPKALYKNPAFSQIVMTQGTGKTIYIGGQNSVNAKGEIIGKGNIELQTKQVMENIQIALESCGASYENLIKFNIYLVQGQNVFLAFQASKSYIGTAPHPPAITGVFVSGLANPDFLIEIDAIAFIPES